MFICHRFCSLTKKKKTQQNLTNRNRTGHHKNIYHVPRLDEEDAFGSRSFVKRVILSPDGFSSNSEGASVDCSSEFIMTNNRKETK